MDLLSGLNEPQRLAVTHDKGPLLIFAGAGSGKTRTLTHRIAYLIEEHHVSTGRILAVTFTNKAAREMCERLENLIGPRAKSMWMGTFHALCARMLRIHGDRIGLNPRFAIFDTDDQVRLVKDILKELNIDTERFPANRVLGRISDAKNQLKSPEAFAEGANKPHEKVYASLYKRYQERLRAASALDFDDLLGESVRLLRESPESLEHWSDRFEHILIDEFQDVNEAQFQWAQMLASKHRNICVVGDDDQCLVAGSTVQTPNGIKPIEEIVVGDQVLGGIGRGEVGFHEVKAVKSKPYNGPVLSIGADPAGEDDPDYYFRATPNHVCFAQVDDEKPQDDSVVLLAFDNDCGTRGDQHSIYSKREGEIETNIDRAEEIALRMARSLGGSQIERFARFGPGKGFVDNANYRFLPAGRIEYDMAVPFIAGFQDFDLHDPSGTHPIVPAYVSVIEEEQYDGLVYDLDVEGGRNFAVDGIL
ncbi:hypothetical protein EON80_24835, partial [bacterium]